MPRNMGDSEDLLDLSMVDKKRNAEDTWTEGRSGADTETVTAPVRGTSGSGTSRRVNVKVQASGAEHSILRLTITISSSALEYPLGRKYYHLR